MRTQQEILRKFEEAYVRDIPPEQRPPLDSRMCECHAFSFPHLRFAGDCQGSDCNGAEFDQEVLNAQA